MKDKCLQFQKPDDSYHKPLAVDIVDGYPKNSTQNEIRTCMDGRKANCIYFLRLAESTDKYSLDLPLCLYAFRK